MNFFTLLPLAIHAAELASAEILSVYESGDFQAEAKGDNSPLTIADKRAHRVIEKELQQTGLPLLSEEGRSIPYEERKNWDYFWLVDPLDGTKEFLKRNGEFTVNIALIHQGVPVLGVVGIPVSGELFYASSGNGVKLRRGGEVRSLPAKTPCDLGQSGLRVVASRSHMNAETEEFIGKLKDPTLVSKGSSLKFLLLVEGQADVYPRYAPTMEWDTAAAHAIVREAGLQVLQAGTESELSYNKPDLLNPYFIVR
ncbi:MAG TPA: 3'(2'),5'-bisphosphate nucleotidase CysQ [Chryseosolibacter sp.]